MTGGLIKPDELKRVTEDIEMAKAREALEKTRKAEHEQHEVREAFMARDVHPEVFERVSRLVKGAAERGQREVLALRFPSSYCTDRGRAINNFEPGWPGTLGSPRRPTSSTRRSWRRWATRCARRSWTIRAASRAMSGFSCAGSAAGGTHHAGG